MALAGGQIMPLLDVRQSTVHARNLNPGRASLASMGQGGFQGSHDPQDSGRNEPELK